MLPKNLLMSILYLLVLAPLMALSIVPPGASTPLFYLVSTSQTSSVNLLPVRMGATLSGSTPPAKFYFTQGQLVIANPDGSSSTYWSYINSVQTANGCSPGGALVITQGFGSNKCARSQTFHIQSNTENSQLGARLVFNYVGGFYACGTNKDIYYKVSASEGPSGCSPVDLYTVPVV